MYPFEMIAIHVDSEGAVSALGSQGCRWLCLDDRSIVADVGGYRVSVEPLGAIEGRDRLLPLALNPDLYDHPAGTA